MQVFITFATLARSLLPQSAQNPVSSLEQSQGSLKVIEESAIERTLNGH